MTPFLQINQLPHLDSTALEEAASSSQLIACFTPSGDVCGVTQMGEGEIEFARLMPLVTVRGFSFLLCRPHTDMLYDCRS